MQHQPRPASQPEPPIQKDIIPGNSELCVLVCPIIQSVVFIDRQDSVFAYKPNEYLKKKNGSHQRNNQ